MSHHFNLYTSSPVKSDGFFSSFGSSFDGRELASDVVLISTPRRSKTEPHPEGTSYFLPRIVGRGRAAEALLTGKPISASKAGEWMCERRRGRE